MDDDDETVLLGLGATLPAGVTPGSPATSTVAITDNDDPEVEVSFDQSAYDVAEGGDVTITVNLSADPERTVEVPLTAMRQGGASGADYSVRPRSPSTAGRPPRPSLSPPPRTPSTTTARASCWDSAPCRTG